MFKEWGFLLVEIWVLLGLAALIGLIAGWLIWGGRVDRSADANELRRLRAELDRAKAENRTDFDDPMDDIPPMAGGGYQRPVSTPAKPLQPATQTVPTRVPEPTTPSIAPMVSSSDPAPVQMPAPSSMTKPAGLSEARDGLRDDLTKIKGVGPKMEKLCNALGFFHYDQIADWTTDEVAWVDDNLEGFKGRVTRDGWVEQSKALAKNDTPAFVRRSD